MYIENPWLNTGMLDCSHSNLFKDNLLLSKLKLLEKYIFDCSYYNFSIV